MKKQLMNKTVYEPNKAVRVTVVNKPIYDEIGQLAGYDADVTVKIKRSYMEKELLFKSDDEIADFMGSVEYDDPQQSLGLGE